MPSKARFEHGDALPMGGARTLEICFVVTNIADLLSSPDSRPAAQPMTAAIVSLGCGGHRGDPVCAGDDEVRG